MPGRADPERDSRGADRVDVSLLVHRLRRDVLAAMTPDDVVEDLAYVLGLIERGEHRADGVRADLMSALDELDELVDDGARSRDVLVVAAEREPVAAERDRAGEPLPQSVEDAVLHAGELRGHLVRDVEHLLHAAQCRDVTRRETEPDLLGTPRPRGLRANRRCCGSVIRVECVITRFVVWKGDRPGALPPAGDRRSARVCVGRRKRRRTPGSASSRRWSSGAGPEGPHQ